MEKRGDFMENFILEDHAPSLLPSGKKWKLVWHDEFDGTELDTSKWGFRRNFWGRKFPAFTDQGGDPRREKPFAITCDRTEWRILFSTSSNSLPYL